MNRFLSTSFIVAILIGSFTGIRYIGSVIHYNCVYKAEDCPPPIKGVGEIGFLLTGGSLLPLWNHDATTVAKISWSIEKADPSIVSSDDFHYYDQKVAVDVTTLNGATKRYDLGTAYGCTGTAMEVIEDHKIMLGKVDCNFAESSTKFAAFVQHDSFHIERSVESAKDGSIATTSLLKIK